MMLFATGLLLAIAYIPDVVGGIDSPRYAVLAIMLPWQLTLLSRIPMTAAHWLGLAFFGFMALSIAWAPNPLWGLGDLCHWAILGLAFAIGSAIDEAGLRSFIRGAAIGLVASTIVAALQQLGILPQIFNSNTGLFVNKNLLAEAAVLTLIGALFLREWWLAVSSAIAIALAPSREAVIALAVVGLFCVPMRWRIAGLASLAAGLIWIAFHPDPTAAVRLEWWHDALAGLTWLGNGAGSYRWTWLERYHAHNDSLQSVYEFGVGAFLLAGICILALARWRLRPVAGGIVLAVLACGAFGYPLELPFTGAFAALAAGHLCGLRDGLCGADDRGADRYALARATRLPVGR
jgi:hypothetical protein